MKARLFLQSANAKRMAAFDAGDIVGTMSQFLPTSKFIIVYPGDTPDVVVEGFDAIKELEEGFYGAILENFGKVHHQLGEWRWISISDKKAVGRVYCKLWLTDKSTGNWNQVDLTGKSGRFWMEVTHVKVSGEWKLESQTAFSEDWLIRIHIGRQIMLNTARGWYTLRYYVFKSDSVFFFIVWVPTSLISCLNHDGQYDQF